MFSNVALFLAPQHGGRIKVMIYNSWKKRKLCTWPIQQGHSKSVVQHRIHDVLKTKKLKIIKGCYLGQQLGEVFKEIGAVEVTVIVDVEFSDKAGDSPELDQCLQSHLLHLIGHLNVL